MFSPVESQKKLEDEDISATKQIRCNCDQKKAIQKNFISCIRQHNQMGKKNTVLVFCTLL